jgi:hypothetical protein
MGTKVKIAIILSITLIIIFIKKIIVLGMIAVGAIFFPEASKVLRHYCFGDGSTLYLKSDYIKNSPVVKRKLAKMKVGQKRKVAIRQWEDYRLSYALNPFMMEKKKNKVVITWWMNFDKTGKVYTFYGPFPLPDNIVHTFNCTPFLVYHEFNYKE